VASDRALLKRARDYEEEALGELYDRYAPLVYSYLYRRVNDAAAAEDLTSEVFLRMLTAFRSGTEWHTSFRAWIYRVAHNLVVDHYRGRPAEPQLELEEDLMADDADLESKLVEQLSRQRVLAAIRLLTADQQEVLALRLGEQLTSREVAQVMGRTVGAVEQLQHRALASLRRVLVKEKS
jgi:RNA polymerase sigma-70 factor (ECF subfamily)